MNRYKIILYPEKAKSEDINLEETRAIVTNAASLYSEKGKRAANTKWIDLESIEIVKDEISFILVSDAWLEFPTKAIRQFISDLSKTTQYSKLITSSGRLFKGKSELIEDDTEIDELSDESCLIEVIKLFFRETEENRKKINAIKKILGGRPC